MPLIRKLIKQPTLIRVCRVVEMVSPQRKINKIGFGSRILRAATSAVALTATGSNGTALDGRAQPTTSQIQLNTAEQIAQVNIPYDVMEDNIERATTATNELSNTGPAGLRQTIIDLIAELAALDMEELGLLGKTPQLHPHQVKLFDETAEFLLQGLSGVVSAFAGWGKTVLGYHAAAVVKRKTLVITTKDDIYKQWLDGAAKFLGLAPQEIGEIRGDNCEVVGTKFCVAMIHSLSKDGKYPDWVTKGFGLVIFDECHRVPADQFSAVVDMFPAKLRLGLSATPERSDCKELLVLAHNEALDHIRAIGSL